MAYDPKYQTSENGPLTPAFRNRVDTVKNRLNYTLAQTGKELGFSGPFVSTLLNAGNPGRVRTKHIERMIDAVEKMEVKAGIRTATSAHQPPAPANGQDAAPANWMEDMIHAAYKRGYALRFEPLARP